MDQSFTFKHPFTCMLAGPSGSGKTTAIHKILKSNHQMIYPNVTQILYCYSRYQPFFDQIKNDVPNIVFNEGLPDIDELDPSNNNLIILDDLMQQVDQSILHLFTVDSHHKNISVFFLTQNLFSTNKHNRTISLNCHYLFLFNNPRDRSQISYLARQMFPTQSKFLIEVYEYVTSKEYGYLFLDFKQSTPNDNRVQTGIFPNEQRMIFQAKKY